MISALIEAALSDFGMAEVRGPANNALILAMARELDVEALYRSDATAWCGLAMGHWVHEAGMTPPPGFLSARAWIKWGHAVQLPQIGSIAVLWRGSPSGWRGHVALFIRDDGDRVFLLGGNQDDAVTIEPFPKSRVLGYRDPSVLA